MTWPRRLLHRTKTLSRRFLNAADWAGEKLASAVGITDPKFDIYLWEHEYRAKEKAEEEANRFIIDPNKKGEEEPRVNPESVPLASQSRSGETNPSEAEGEEERCYTALETLPPV